MAATRTTPDLTFFGPLTTTFTPAPSCFQHLYYLLPDFDIVNNTIFRGLSASSPILGWETQQPCYPPAPPSDTRIPGWMNLNLGYYSPGVCPSGYSTACAEQQDLLMAYQTGALCCPSNFSCTDTPNSAGVITWCTSRILADTLATGVITRETTTTVMNTHTTTTITITETPSTVTVRPTLRDGSGNPALATVIRIRWGEPPKTSHVTAIAVAVPITLVFLAACIALFVCCRRRRRVDAGFVIPDGPELDAEDARVNEIEGMEHTPVRHELDAELAVIEAERVERVVVPEPEVIGLERLRGVGNVARMTPAELLDVLTRSEESAEVMEGGLVVGEGGHTVV